MSVELAQDAEYFRALRSGRYGNKVSLEYEEPLFISGTGSGHAFKACLATWARASQRSRTSNGNLVSIAATLSVLGALKSSYHKNATWLMTRATSLIIRTAQVGAGLYEPVFRRENGIDFLHGYPCEYSVSMSTAARGATPVLFGDFRKGYVIGDRGGSALIIKVVEPRRCDFGPRWPCHVTWL